jgi:hypothetical protein
VDGASNEMARTDKAQLVRASGLVCSVAYAALIVSVYAQKPRTVAQLRGGVASSLGAYHVDRVSFEEGLRFFHNGQYAEARAALARADPASQDAQTQFYVAYSYYRQGWGRLYSDDALFTKGIEAVDRAIAASADGRVVVTDPDLRMHTADELRAELQRGLTRELSDLNPLKVFRERK